MASSKKDLIKLQKPKKTAGGIKAVQSASQHILQEMNPGKGFKTLQKMNQKDGFDCPGCAWPDPSDKRSQLGEYCENGAKAIAEEATDKRIGESFFQKHSISALKNESDYWLGKQGRLTQPLYLAAGSNHYQAIQWTEAFTLISNKLNKLNHPNEAIFYTSGRTSNEAAFLYQLFVRTFGTNNLPDCSNMCHESSGTGLSETLGIGKGSVTLDDFYHSELILIIGQNPGTNHPRMLSALQKAKEMGAHIISINPLPEAGLMRFKNPQDYRHFLNGGIQLSDIFLQVRINQDIALLKALMKLLIAKEKQNPGEILDPGFIADKSQGFEALEKDLDNYELEDLIEQSGVAFSDIDKAAELLAQKKRIIICWAMGLTQHKNGVANIRECVNLLLMKGSIGKKGAGTCPVRGHSNVQGDRTMGIWEKPKKAFLDCLDQVFEMEAPREPGWNTIESIQAMQEGKGKVFFALGGNFLSASPDTQATARALENCEMTVQVSTKLNRSHLHTGKEALILPCLGRTEIDQQATGKQFVSVENSMGVVHSSEGILPPASAELRSEPWIIARLAEQTLGAETNINWMELVSDYDRIRNLIEKVIPGFEDYNKRVRKGNGFYLPNGAREGRFNTPTGKAHFTINSLPAHRLEKDEFMMMTIRSHDQFNTTIYGLNDRYRGIHQARRVVMMNAEDMKQKSLKALDLVDLISHYEGEKRVAASFQVVPYDIPSKCVATYFPEANVLVPLKHKADKSNTPASKSVIIRIENSDS